MSAQIVFVDKHLNVKQEHDDFINRIVREKGGDANWSSVARELLEDSIRYYFQKRRRALRLISQLSVPEQLRVQAAIAIPEPLPDIEEKPIKGSTAHCQMTGCGREVNKKKLHKFQLQQEIFLFCETCFFTGAYKELIRRIL